MLPGSVVPQGRHYRAASHILGGGISPVKRGNPTATNPVQGRLLLLAGLFNRWPEKPSYRKVEDIAGLNRGALKDCVKRCSISKGVATKLLEIAPRYGIRGLTLDWLQLGRGPDPQGGEMPPRRPASARSTPGTTQASPDRPPALESPESAELRLVPAERGEVWDMIGRLVGAAVQKVLERDEQDTSQQGRQVLADALTHFALELDHTCHIEALAIVKVAQDLREGRIG